MTTTHWNHERNNWLRVKLLFKLGGLAVYFKERKDKERRIKRVLNSKCCGRIMPWQMQLEFIIKIRRGEDEWVKYWVFLHLLVTHVCSSAEIIVVVSAGLGKLLWNLSLVCEDPSQCHLYLFMSVLYCCVGIWFLYLILWDFRGEGRYLYC